MSAIDYEKELNEEQRAAVMAPDGPVLVIAAAGTGKTRTLTYRVAHLVEQGVDPRRILLCTFTNKAASEMLDRARGLVGESVSGLWGGTFHHLANRFLRRHGDRLGYRNDYTILDQDDAKKLVRACVNELNLRDKSFPKPEVLLNLFGYARNARKPVEDIAHDRFAHHKVEPEAIIRVFEAYQKQKRALNGMDFDDLLVQAVALFEQEEDIAQSYSERFQYVLVDEYQDTNPLQAQLVDRIAERHRNVLVVGDDFQSIYSWRGADAMHILSFPKKYSDAKVFKLETNYRSTPDILNVANACIAGNADQFQKTLRAVREPHQPPRVQRLRDGRQQALFIIEQLHRLRSEGYSLKDMAVLYRSHYHAMELQMELTREGFPYVITSGVRFFEQAHIKDVMTVLKLMHHPGDELSFIRLLCLLPKVGEKTALKGWRRLERRFNPRLPEHRMIVEDSLPPSARPLWKSIADVFARADEEDYHAAPGELVYRFVEAFYDEYAAETFDNYERRIEDIEEMNTFMARFSSLTDFLSEVALLTNLETQMEPEEEQASIRLSTIHQAKGLEWPVVFILWLTEGLFPSARSLEDLGGDAEERRLFYVAATRAKDELYLCVPQMRRDRSGNVQFYSPSRFVQELPDHLLTVEPAGYR